MISYIKSIFHNPNAPMQLPEISSHLKSLKKSKLDQQNSDLVPYDMFFPDDSDREIVHKKLYGQEPFSNTKENKAFGAFLGTAIGNALGVLTEGFNIDYNRKEVTGFEAGENALALKKWSSIGHYTAGTSLALCISDSLLSKNFQYDGKDIRYRFLLWHHSGLNNGKNIEMDPVCRISVGAGRTMLNSLIEFIHNPEPRVDSYGKQNNDGGNGTLIRIVPFPIAFNDDLNKCLEYATEQSYTTHNGIEAAECSRLISFITWNFLNIESVGECKVFLENTGSAFKTECPSVQCLSQSGQENQDSLKFYNPTLNVSVEDRNWNWKNAEYKYSPSRSKQGSGLVGMYCMDATAMALHIIYHADSFKDAVLRAVNLGGDSVSLGCIVGTLAGAMFGYDDDVKKWYLENVMKWDEGKCAIRAYKLLKNSKKTADGM